MPSSGDLPNPGIEPRSLTLQADSLLTESPGKPKNTEVGSLSLFQGIFPTQESNQGFLHCSWATSLATREALYAEYIVLNVGLDESQAGIKIAGRNINNLRVCRWYSFNCRKLGWKSWLKTQHYKNLRSWHPVPSVHGKQKGKKWKQWQILFSWAPKSLQMVSAAMELKDACSWEGKLWQN